MGKEQPIDQCLLVLMAVRSIGDEGAGDGTRSTLLPDLSASPIGSYSEVLAGPPQVAIGEKKEDLDQAIWAYYKRAFTNVCAALSEGIRMDEERKPQVRELLEAQLRRWETA